MEQIQNLFHPESILHFQQELVNLFLSKNFGTLKNIERKF